MNFRRICMDNELDYFLHIRIQKERINSSAKQIRQKSKVLDIFQKVIKLLFITSGSKNAFCTIAYCATRGKKYILRLWSLIPERSEGNNHTRYINVSPVVHTIFFLLGAKIVYCAIREKTIYFASVRFNARAKWG